VLTSILRKTGSTASRLRHHISAASDTSFGATLNCNYVLRIVREQRSPRQQRVKPAHRVDDLRAPGYTMLQIQRDMLQVQHYSVIFHPGAERPRTLEGSASGQ
jgi:hypothetical protein